MQVVYCLLLLLTLQSVSRIAKSAAVTPENVITNNTHLNDLLSEAMKTMSAKSQLILVFDARSENIRATLFNATSVSFGAIIDELDSVISDHPLAGFGNDPIDKVGARYLREFLIKKVLPMLDPYRQKQLNVSSYLGATGAVRMMPAELRKSLIDEASKTLMEFNLIKQSTDALVVPGKIEASYIWKAANFRYRGMWQPMPENVLKIDGLKRPKKEASVISIDGTSAHVSKVKPLVSHTSHIVGQIEKDESWLGLGARAMLAQFATSESILRRGKPGVTPCIVSGLSTTFTFRGKKLTLVGDNETSNAERFEVCKFLAEEYVIQRNVRLMDSLNPFSNDSVLVVGSLSHIVIDTSRYVNCELKKMSEETSSCIEKNVTVADLETNARHLCSMQHSHNSTEWHVRYCILINGQLAFLRQIGLPEEAILIPAKHSHWPVGMTLEYATDY